MKGKIFELGLNLDPINIFIDKVNLNYINTDSVLWNLPNIKNNLLKIDYTQKTLDRYSGTYKDVFSKFLFCCFLIERTNNNLELKFKHTLDLYNKKLFKVIKDYLGVDKFKISWLEFTLEKLVRTLDNANKTKTSYSDIIELLDFVNCNSNMRPGICSVMNEKSILKLFNTIYESEESLKNFLFNINSYYSVRTSSSQNVIGKLVIHYDKPIGDVEVLLKSRENLNILLQPDSEIKTLIKGIAFRLDTGELSFGGHFTLNTEARFKYITNDHIVYTDFGNNKKLVPIEITYYAN